MLDTFNVFIIFLIFSFITIVSAVIVVTSRNPITSVLFLILTFFSVSALFLTLGAEFLAMILIIVYVGAIAVLFLFIVMMLDINLASLRAHFVRYWPLGILIGVILFSEILFIISYLLFPHIMISMVSPSIIKHLDNTRSLGMMLYTQYVLAFESGALILLVAMIGAIVLTLRKRPGVRRQNISQQVSIRSKDEVRLVNVPNRKGIE